MSHECSDIYVVHVNKRVLLILSVFFFATLTPFSQTISTNASAEPVQVCCDSASVVDLFLIGDTSGQLTPFSQKLDTESSSAIIANAITSEEELGIWSMGDVWPGEVPESTWSFGINYIVSDAGGAQVNATATIKIGSLSFSASTDIGSSVLPQGEGVLNFDIPVDATSLSASSDVELVLTARTVVFSVPGSDAKLELMWGSEEHDSKITAEIPLLDLTIEDPIIEGGDIYIPLKIESPFGLDTLAYSDSIELRINNQVVTGNPVETQSGDSIIVTWTWQGAAGGTENIQVSVRLSLQPSGPLLSGQAEFEIETFDSGGGTGTFYPQDEPLRTSGVGSPLSVTQIAELSNSQGKLKISRTTTLEIDGEMAFWIRWGMDHIGDTNLPTSSVLYGWNPGSVSDEERISRNIETVEVEQYQREMVKRFRTYMSDVNGMQIDSGKLLGDSSDFDTISISIDLMGETKVVNHPVSLKFSTLQTIDDDGERFYLMRTFTSTQSAPLWQKFSLNIEATSSGMTSFAGAELLESDDLIFKHSRLPWGEKITVEGDSISLAEDFTISLQPTKSIFYGPTSIIILAGVLLLLGLLLSLRVTRTRHRRFLMFELVLIPLVLVIYYFSYPAVFVVGASVMVVCIWFITSVASPRRYLEEAENPVIEASIPTIGCPACQTINPVMSDERPLRIACSGCGRTIKIVG